MALIGIARLAAHSELLEAKRQVRYFEIPARSLLNRTKPTMPFQWTLNPYRGCEFGCRYCYARYTHEFMELDIHDFEDQIYAKSAPAHRLRGELKRVAPAGVIAIGTATDPYQPAERRFGRTRAVLEVLSVNFTVTTLDEPLARLFEPRAPRPELRLEALGRLAQAGILAGVFPNPVMPLLTDREADLDRLARAARDAGAQYFGGGPLFLMPCAQKVFLPFLEEHFPDLAPRYRRAYRFSAYLPKDYRERLEARIGRVRHRRGLGSGPVDYRPELWEDDPQGRLFPG